MVQKIKKNQVLMLVLTTFFYSCNTSQVDKAETENGHGRGSLKVLSDEAFKPIMSTATETFEAIYPQAKLEMQYMPQENAIRKLVQGEYDVAIAGRAFTKSEEELISRRGRIPKTTKIASDALVFIVSETSKEKVITEEKISSILAGTSDIQLVSDKSNSGNLLYLKNRFKQAAELKNIAAAGSDSAVIEYISTHPNAIGMIGMTLVSDYDDPKVKKRLEKVNLLSVAYKDSSGRLQEGYPVQEELITGQYPFIRDIFILNLDGQKNLGTGFANYLAGEDGQRIILKSGLLPSKMPTRDIIIKQ